MSTPTVTDEATGEQHTVERAAAPGADLLDPDCQHGAPTLDPENMTDFQKEWHPQVQMYMLRMKMIPPLLHHSPGPVFLLRYNQDFWTSDPKVMAILRRDVAFEIPRMLWSEGVKGSCMEQGGAGYSRMCISGSLVTESLIQNPGANVQDILDGLWGDMNAINSDSGLYAFMHRETKRKCLCMQYVAAEANKGAAKKCCSCGGTADKLRRCSRCKNVWYCNVDCQKKAWKTHKQVCQPSTTFTT